MVFVFVLFFVLNLDLVFVLVFVLVLAHGRLERDLASGKSGRERVVEKMHEAKLKQKVIQVKEVKFHRGSTRFLSFPKLINIRSIRSDIIT